MKISKSIIEKAKQIRKEASEKFGFPEVEFDFPSCVALAIKKEKQKMEKTKHQYEFDYCIDQRKAKPYVAQILGRCEKYGLKREFLSLDRDFKKHDMLLYGKVELEDYTILEICYDSSWKNVYKGMFLCYQGKITRIKDFIDNLYDFQDETKYIKTALTVSCIETIGKELIKI